MMRGIIRIPKGNISQCSTSYRPISPMCSVPPALKESNYLQSVNKEMEAIGPGEWLVEMSDASSYQFE